MNYLKKNVVGVPVLSSFSSFSSFYGCSGRGFATAPLLSFRPSLPSRETVTSYDDMKKAFQWRIPTHFNMGVACSDYHVSKGNGDFPALIDHHTNHLYRFNDISKLSNKLSNVFINKLKMKRQDRIAILLSQSIETGVSHLACFKSGCISLPLFTLFGLDALMYRLNDSQSKTIITNTMCLDNILQIRDQLPYLQHIIVTDLKHSDESKQILSWGELLEQASSDFSPVQTSPDDPAIIIYTSGTTGNPKGCLHGHRVLLGHMPGVEMPQNFFPQPGDVFFTPADFAWIGGLFDALLPSWYNGIPIVTYRPLKFDPDECLHLMQKHHVRNTFMPPTALKMLKANHSNHPSKKHQLRSLGSGGETLGESLFEYGKIAFDVTIAEFYGQTECNLIVSNCPNLFEVRKGSMGKSVVGHNLAVVDPVTGQEVKPGEVGTVAVKRPDPVMFLAYWNIPEKTKEKFIGDWMLTGDQASIDEDGYFWFVGRDDDIIKTSGYRCGPTEIEQACIKHSAVVNAAAIGKPDLLRNEIIKVFLVLTKEKKQQIQYNKLEAQKLEKEIKDFVCKYLGKHEYPREIEFIDELPMTVTGKVQRKVLKQKEIDKMLTKK